MTSNMQPYHNLLQNIMDNGIDLLNQRTGIVCRYLFSQRLDFNMADGFPATTRKKLAFKSCVGELLGFFRGYTQAAEFESVGTKVWYANANETKSWLESPYRKGDGDNGRIYGVNWNAWRDSRIAESMEERDRLIKLGYKVEVDGATKWAMVRYINQLDTLLETLLTNPSDRRMIISGWNVAELDMMSLPPCHHTYTFVANPDGTLDLECAMRSWDTFLAFNIPLTAIFLHVVARLSGRTPGKMSLTATNAHAYSNHFDAIDLMLSRDDYPAPKLVLSDNIKPVTLETIPGAFARINPEDIWMEGYESHPAIKAEMAA